MPKITFYNLPEHKKQTLIDAAKKEFSRVPLSKASIANIVKSADIPRGSFYQYFEDKEDAFFYLLNKHVKENKEKFMLILNEHNGDLFDTMIEFFKLIIEEEENFKFLKNTFLNMTHEIESILVKSFTEDQKNENYEELGCSINQSILNISDEKELFHIMQIVTAVTLRNFVDKFAKELTYDEAVNQYKIEINLLKNGLAKSSEYKR